MEQTTYKVPKILQTIFFGTVGFLVGFLIIVVLLKVFQHPSILILSLAAEIAIPIWLNKKYKMPKNQMAKTFSYGILIFGIVCTVLIISTYTTVATMFQSIAN